MRRRQRMGLLLQLLLVLTASLLGVVTNLATGDDEGPYVLKLLEQIAVPGLVVLVLLLIAGHAVAYRLENPPEPTLPWDRGRSPYPGLAAFHEDEAAVYFGRDALTTAVLRRLHEHGNGTEDRFGCVIGASGSGKSSLVQAGVLPRIRSQRWTVIGPILPGSDPIGSLARPLAEETGDSAEAVARRLRRDRGELAALLTRAGRRSGSTFRRTLLVIDQMEELVTLSGDRDRTFLLDALARALARHRNLHVLSTLRVEFLSDLLSEEGARLFSRPLAVGAIDREALLDIIVEPAALAGMTFEKGLPERIVADTQRGDALPLLAYLLQELFARVGPDRTATSQDYLALGGVEGALARHADQVLAELREWSDTSRVLSVLLKFVTVTGREATRRRVRLCDLDPEERRIVDAFIDARLLVSDVEQGTPTAQVAHEALFQQWSPLRQEVDAHAERLRNRAELERWAADWERAGHSPDYLLTGQRLRTAEQWLESLREVEQASQQAERLVEASRRRDQGFLERVSRNIAEYVLADVERYPELAVLLCTAAVDECGSTTLLRRALLTALAFSHARLELTGHTDTVRNVSWSPDGSWIATASRDGTAGIWEADTGAIRTVLRGHMGMVEMVRWSPDSARVATASRDGTVRVWDVATGASVLRLDDATDVVRGVAWSPDGRWVAGASRDRTVRVWSAETGHVVTKLTGHADNVLGVAWSPDGRRLATASHDQRVIVWDVGAGTAELELLGHLDLVEGVAWSPDGSRIATASGDHTVRLWDSRGGGQELLIRGHRDRVWNVAWSPDGRMVATASADRTARVFTVNDAHEVAVLRGHTDTVWGVDWCPSGERLVTGSEDGSARVWDLTPESMEEWSRGRHGAPVTSVARDVAGERVAAAAEDGTVTLHRSGNALIRTRTLDHGGKVRAVAHAPDGTALVSVGTDRRALLWRAGEAEETEPLVLDGHDGAIIESVAWSPDGTRVATGGQDRVIRVWESREGGLLAEISGHQDWVVGLAWSPSGRMIASTSDDRTARVWDVATGRERLVLSGHDNWVDAVAWSPDERWLVTGSADWTARVWNAVTGEQRTVLSGHEGRVSGVDWSPDGQRVATASADRTVRVWDPADGAEATVVGVHRDRATSVVWSADSLAVIAGGADGTVRRWPAHVDTDQLLVRARGRVFRSLTVEERRAHMLAVDAEAQ